MAQTNTDNKVQLPPSVLFQGGGQDSGFNTLPANQTLALLEAMLAIQKYEKTVLDNSAELQKEYAMALGGSVTGADGKETFSASSGNGIISHLYEIGVDVGTQKANQLEDDAFGKFAQAGVGAASLGVSAATFMAKTNPVLNKADDDLVDVKAMDTQLKTPASDLVVGGPGDEIEMEDFGARDPEFQNKVNAKMKGWADGSEPLDNFRAKNPDGTVDEDQAAINRKAAQQAQNHPDELAKIQKRLNERETSVQNQKATAETKFNTYQQFITTATTALNNVAGATAEIYQSADAIAEAKASANNTILTTNTQQVVDAERKVEEKAQEAQQQISQWAANFAQAAAAQVHA